MPLDTCMSLLAVSAPTREQRRWAPEVSTHVRLQRTSRLDIQCCSCCSARRVGGIHARRERGRMRKCLTACTGLCRRAGRGRNLRCRCARDAGSPGGRHGGRAAAHQRPPAGAAVAPPGRLRWQACTNQSRGCTNVGWEARQGACMAGSVTYPAHVHAQVAERCRTRTVPNHDYSRFDSGARARSLAGGPCGGGRRAAGV